jgi:thiopeptide-type bacteriocin biosynthesis domain
MQLQVTGQEARRETALSAPFRVADASRGMARVPMLPHDDPEPDGQLEPVVAEGIFLCSDIRALSPPGQAERRRATTRAFQIRARRRTTPQGVFAAAVELQVDDGGLDLTVRTGPVRSYPNPVWLHEVCSRLLDNPDVLRGLRFTASNLAVRRGSRLEIDRPSGDTVTGPQRVSIRATAAVDVIMDVCRTGASWAHITAALARTWPDVPYDTVDSALRTLVRHGFVLTDLTAPDPSNDPLGHVLAKLPMTEPLRGPLSQLRAALVEADRRPPGHAARLAALKTARSLTDDIASVWRPVCVDSACETPVRIPRDLAAQAAAVANILWRLAPGHDQLDDWHERFLRRYGAHRLVPIMDACDPVTGLGCHLSESHPPPDSDVTAVLAGLLADALASGEIEVRLDAETIDALDRRKPDDRPPPSVEVYARVVAPNTHARDAGKFILVVTGLAAPAGSTRARFTGLLPACGVDADTGHGTMTAELAYQPLSHAVAALTGPADGAPWRIPIGTIPRPGDLLLEELALVSDERHLSLWSTRYDRPVRPVHHNQVGHHLTPPLAAFLCLVGQHGTVPLSPWSWAPFDRAPFLPRVRHGDSIVFSARWRLPKKLLAATGDPSRWNDALREWRSCTHPPPPRVVLVDDTDRQLPLNLDRSDDRELLRRYAARGVNTVAEPPGGADATQAVAPGPTGYHALEIVVPLTAATEAATTQPSKARDVRRPGLGLFLPGSEWLSLAVTAPPSTQDEALAHIAATAQEAAGLWDLWFWLRYHSPDRGHHLRVRFHGDPATLGGQLLPLLRQTCTHLMKVRLASSFAIEPYEQEVERYGGPDSITTAELVFHHDAELAAAIITTTTDIDERIALAAVSAAEITRILADRDNDALVPYRLDRADRRIQARIRPRCRAVDDTTKPHPGLWQARAFALKTYRDLLPPQRRIDCASSLIHMHANRLLGNHRQERIARSLAADLIARNTQCPSPSSNRSSPWPNGSSTRTSWSQPSPMPTRLP